MGAFAQPVVEHERPEDLVPPLDRDVGLDDLVPEIRQDSGDGLDGAGDRGIDRTSVRAPEEGDPPVPHRGAFEGRLGEDLRHDAGFVHRPGQRAGGDEISHRAETPFVRARSGGRLEPDEPAARSRATAPESDRAIRPRWVGLRLVRAGRPAGDAHTARTGRRDRHAYLASRPLRSRPLTDVPSRFRGTSSRVRIPLPSRGIGYAR